MGSGISTTVSLKGEKALLRSLKILDKEVAGRSKKYMRRSLRAGLKPVLQQARTNAKNLTVPSNQTEIMQKVASGMKIRAIRRSRKHFGLRIQTPSRAKLGLPPYSGKGPGRFYIPTHVEIGTKRVEAKPYLRNALKSKRERAIRVFKVTMWRLIKGHTVKYRR